MDYFKFLVILWSKHGSYRKQIDLDFKRLSEPLPTPFTDKD